VGIGSGIIPGGASMQVSPLTASPVGHSVGTPTHERRARLYAWPGQQHTPWVSGPTFCPGGHACSHVSPFGSKPLGQTVGTPMQTPRDAAYTWPGQQQWPSVSLVITRPVGQGWAKAEHAPSAAKTTKKLRADRGATDGGNLVLA
jgi:hypothetical protein